MRHMFTLSVLVLAAATTAAEAQQSTGTAMTADEIAVCLCQEQAIEQQRAQVDIQGSLLAERQQELNNLDAEIKRQALRLSPTDVVGQQVLQDIIGQQIALRNLIQLRIRPDYSQQVRQLNEGVEAYTAQCTTRPRYVLDVERAEENLSCPKP